MSMRLRTLAVCGGLCLALTAGCSGGSSGGPSDDQQDDRQQQDDQNLQEAVAQFAGSYSGEVSGEDEGQWDVSVSEDGTVSGDMRSAVNGVSFPVEGEVDAEGNLTLSAAIEQLQGLRGLAADLDKYRGWIFIGKIDLKTGVITGQWKWQESDTTWAGSCEAVKQDPETVPENRAPIIGGGSDLRIELGQAVPVVVVNVLDKETAAADLTVTATSSNQTLLTDAGITLGGTGSERSVALVPEVDAVGTTTVTVTVSDGEKSDSMSFGLEVFKTEPPAPINHAPVVQSQQASTLIDQTVDIALSATDADGDTLVFSLPESTTVAGAMLALNGQTVTYTPATGFSGNDSFTVVVNDGTTAVSVIIEVYVQHPIEGWWSFLGERVQLRLEADGLSVWSPFGQKWDTFAMTWSEDVLESINTEDPSELWRDRWQWNGADQLTCIAFDISYDGGETWSEVIGEDEPFIGQVMPRVNEPQFLPIGSGSIVIDGVADEWTADQLFSSDAAGDQRLTSSAGTDILGLSVMADDDSLYLMVELDAPLSSISSEFISAALEIELYSPGYEAYVDCLSGGTVEGNASNAHASGSIIELELPRSLFGTDELFEISVNMIGYPSSGTEQVLDWCEAAYGYLPPVAVPGVVGWWDFQGWKFEIVSAGGSDLLMQNVFGSSQDMPTVNLNGTELVMQGGDDPYLWRDFYLWDGANQLTAQRLEESDDNGSTWYDISDTNPTDPFVGQVMPRITAPLVSYIPEHTITIDGSLDDWSPDRLQVSDAVGDTRLTTNSGADITALSVSADGSQVYVLVELGASISALSGEYSSARMEVEVEGASGSTWTDVYADETADGFHSAYAISDTAIEISFSRSEFSGDMDLMVHVAMYADDETIGYQILDWAESALASLPPADGGPMTVAGYWYDDQGIYREFRAENNGVDLIYYDDFGRQDPNYTITKQDSQVILVHADSVWTRQTWDFDGDMLLTLSQVETSSDGVSWSVVSEHPDLGMLWEMVGYVWQKPNARSIVIDGDMTDWEHVWVGQYDDYGDQNAGGSFADLDYFRMAQDATNLSLIIDTNGLVSDLSSTFSPGTVWFQVDIVSAGGQQTLQVQTDGTVEGIVSSVAALGEYGLELQFPQSALGSEEKFRVQVALVDVSGPIDAIPALYIELPLHQIIFAGTEFHPFVINADGQTPEPVPFELWSRSVDPATLALSFSTSNDTLLPATNVTIVRDGATGMVELYPIDGLFGHAWVDIELDDGLTGSYYGGSILLQQIGSAPIHQVTVSIDGSFDDWTGLAPQLTDAAGDGDSAYPEQDITAISLAMDASYLYVKVDRVGTKISSGEYSNVSIGLHGIGQVEAYPFLYHHLGLSFSIDGSDVESASVWYEEGLQSTDLTPIVSSQTAATVELAIPITEVTLPKAYRLSFSTNTDGIDEDQRDHNAVTIEPGGNL